MRNIVLAILAVALATLAPSATAAEGDSDRDDDAGVRQPTMRELANKIDSAVRDIRGVQTTVGNLRTELGTLSTTVTANHTTIVGKFAPQMAVVMSVPQWDSAFINSENFGPIGRLHLVGESTIPGFPAGTVGANGSFMDNTLPAGTYLFELQQPYGDNTICQRGLSRRHGIANAGSRHRAACPSVRLHPFNNRTRLEDGYGIYTYAAPGRFHLRHKFPSGLKFSEDTRLSATERASASSVASYTGAVRITKLE